MLLQLLTNFADFRKKNLAFKKYEPRGKFLFQQLVVKSRICRFSIKYQIYEKIKKKKKDAFKYVSL